MKKYWLYIEPYTQIFVKDNVAVIYNSLSRKGWKLIILSKKVKKIINQLIDLKNMYCIELGDSDLSDNPLSEFISKLRESFSGELIEKAVSNNKPAILVPEMRIQEDVKTIHDVDKFRSSGNGILKYLSEISFYIIGNNSRNSLLNLEVYKQFDYLFNHGENFQLPFSSLSSVLNQVQMGSIGRINVLGGNIFHYKEMTKFTERLKHINAAKYYFVYYMDIPDDNRSYRIFLENRFFLKILIDFPIRSSDFEKKILQIKETPINIEWLFAVTSELEYTEVELIIDKYYLSNVEIVPVYTGNNLNFFINNVFLSEDEVLKSNLSRQEIFMNQAINTFNFGKLTYLPNGEVYANVNCSCLGTIDDSVKEIIYNEICRKTAWFKIRDQEPCSKCVYQFLCPSPSNYEFAIGKPNLCKVN